MCKDNFGEIMYIHLFLLYDPLSILTQTKPNANFLQDAKYKQKTLHARNETWRLKFEYENGFGHFLNPKLFP